MSSTLKGSVCVIVAFAATTMWAAQAVSYDTYSQDGNTNTNCRACHGDFRASDYFSLSDGASWGVDLHDLHRFTMLAGDCSSCHTSPGFFPVGIGSSDGGTGFEAISCVGCHGRNEDAGNDSISDGLGAGLRQHHWNAGTTVCGGCHSDSNPSNYTPVSEDVLPSYYFTPDANHADKPTDPCSPNGEEDYAGSTNGLDNDGDDAYDTADPDCTGCVDPCDDGNACTDGDMCDGDVCVGTPANCSGLDDDCNVGVCNDMTGACEAQLANEGQPCNGGMGVCSGGICEAVGGCDPPDCDDSVDCTDDACVDGVCQNVPNDANCPDDGLFCTGEEICDPALDCVSTGDPCVDGNPVAAFGSSERRTRSRRLRRVDSARLSRRISGITVCNEDTNTCDIIPVCGDGILEPGEECDDGNVMDGDCCSADCTFEPQGSPCADDGIFCNGDEVCDANDGCVSTGDPCGGGTPICNPVNDQCVECLEDADCNILMGEECILNVCVGPGGCDPPDCDDGVACTIDECENDICVNVPSDALCPDDGIFCNGDEVCDANDGCVSTGNPCSGETPHCDPVGNECVECLEDSDCGIGEECILDECVPVIGCIPPDCDDGVACTIDECDNDICVNVPSDALCPDDGMFCTGEEICDAALGCVSTGNPCPPGAVCDEDADTCQAEDDRVTICHIPPGNPENAHTITVSANAVPAHLAHGDTLGPCEDGE